MARSLVRLKLIEGLVLGSLGTSATHGVLIVPIASGIVLGRNRQGGFSRAHLQHAELRFYRTIEFPVLQKIGFYFL